MGGGSGRACPRKGLPARPWPPWADCLFPPAQRRQSWPGKEPRQVRAGLSPPRVPALRRVFFPPVLEADTDTTETETEIQSDRDTRERKRLTETIEIERYREERDRDRNTE